MVQVSPSSRGRLQYAHEPSSRAPFPTALQRGKKVRKKRGRWQRPTRNSSRRAIYAEWADVSRCGASKTPAAVPRPAVLLDAPKALSPKNWFAVPSRATIRVIQQWVCDKGNPRVQNMGVVLHSRRRGTAEVRKKTEIVMSLAPPRRLRQCHHGIAHTAQGVPSQHSASCKACDCVISPPAL